MTNKSTFQTVRFETSNSSETAKTVSAKQLKIQRIDFPNQDDIFIVEGTLLSDVRLDSYGHIAGEFVIDGDAQKQTQKLSIPSGQGRITFALLGDGKATWEQAKKDVVLQALKKGKRIQVRIPADENGLLGRTMREMLETSVSNSVGVQIVPHMVGVYK